MKRYKTYQDIM